KAALERGASEDELRVLTQKLREAMAGKVRDLARRAEQNPLGARQPFPAEVQLILDKAIELRQKTQHATPEQLAELAQQQDVLREQLQAYRKSANSRANKAGDDKTNQFTRDRKCGS
ncbi:TIGR02302 family protein, partial [Bradyrhizobium sp. SHOUNA76]|nr:TIGR02302 family protein [Bradyrhizobium sp. SHOUNA76]